MKKTIGKIHSFESFGTLDGPGIRTVIFLAGCHLRCKYCHNIDVVFDKNPRSMTPEEVLKKVLKNKLYFDLSDGGVTLSGGDPMKQPEFVEAFLKRCKKEKIHTTLDTSLFTNTKFLDKIIPYTDLFLISLKHFNDEKHKALTSVTNKPILENIEYLKKKQKRMWLRFLVVPGYTDSPENLKALVDFCKKIQPEEVELLDYHTMGVAKWKNLGLKYELEEVKPPTKQHMKNIKKKLKNNGLNVLWNDA